MTESEPIEKLAQRPDEHGSTTGDQDEDDEACPNGEEWCEGPESDDPLCFRCFLDGREDSR